MNSRVRIRTLIFGALLATPLTTTKLFAQDHARGPEPPIPVYFEYSGRTDSLQATQEGSIITNGSSLGFILRKYDSLQVQIEKSTAQSTVHFIWLYSLIAVLGGINIVLLYFISRIRKELSEVKRFEHHQALTGSQILGDRLARETEKSSARPLRAGTKKKQK